MIIRKDQPQNDQGTENRAERYGAFALLRYSEVGGLTDGTLVKSGGFSYASGSTLDDV